eukprot:tig00020684_g12866.t1
MHHAVLSGNRSGPQASAVGHLRPVVRCDAAGDGAGGQAFQAAHVQDDGCAAAADVFRGDASAASPARSRSAVDLLKALWAFTRPHTIYGTTLSICCTSALALNSAPALSLRVWGMLAVGLACGLLSNVAITGLNQIYDVEIDKINKPYLPIASGALSPPEANRIVGAATLLAAALSFAPALFAGPALAPASPALPATIVFSLLLGFAYSAPPFRLKRFPLAASLCIFVVRGLVANLGFFAHARWAAGLPLSGAARPLSFAAGVFSAFGLVIALLKDVPDVAGDRQHRIRSFAVRLGERPVFAFSVAALAATYAYGFVVAGLRSPVAWSRTLQCAAHAGLGALALWRARGVEPASSASVTAYYMFMWKLFYAEYLLLPFFR